MTLISAKLSLDTLLRWAVVVLMAAITLNVLWQVFTRFILQNPSSFTDELARYMLIWLGLLGAAYVMGQRGHLAIDILLNKLSPRVALLVDGVILAAIALFAIGVMTIGGMNLVFLTYTLEQISPALNVSLGVIYLALPLSGIFIAFYASVFLIDVVRSYRGEERMFIETRPVE
jgi:TRAP-type C4-dicarboxylate transport system permease small subunit